jgi:hypothetical protein
MFNLAKMRKKIPDDLKKYEAVYQTRSLDTDATKVAFMIAREHMMAKKDAPQNILAVLMAVPYWKFVERYHLDYLKSVLKNAKIKAKQLIHTFKKNPGQFPMPQPKGGEGGGMGGMPPPGGPMASRDARIVTAAETQQLGDDVPEAAGRPGGMYVRVGRDHNADWKLQHTWGAVILAGIIPIIMPDGSTWAVGTPDDDMLVPRNSRTVPEIIRMEKDMPEEMVNAIVETCRKHGIAGIGVPEAYAFINFVKKSGMWNFSIFNALQTDLSMAYMMFMADPDGDLVEPRGTTELRQALGAILYSHVERLMDALVYDGKIKEYKEWSPDSEDFDLFMPMTMFGCSEAAKRKVQMEKKKNLETIAKEISEPPMVLSTSDLDRRYENFNMSSLIMTAVSQSADPVARDMAVQRLANIMEYHWPVYSLRPIKDAELANMRDIPRTHSAGPGFAVDVLSILISASKQSDADFLETYIETNNPRIKEMLARMAAGQKRKDVIKAHPDMALSTSSGVINEVFRQLDPVENLETIKKVMVFEEEHKTGGVPVLFKLQEAACKTADKNLLYIMLRAGPTTKFAKFYVIEHGDDKDKDLAELKQGALSTLRNMSNIWGGNSFSEMFLMAANLAKSTNDEKLLKEIPTDENIGLECLPLLGKDVAEKYMKTARKTLDGRDMPPSWEIHSLPDDPVGLTKAYESIGDINAILVLFATGLEQFDQNDVQLDYALRYMYNAIATSGDKQVMEWANQALRRENVHLGDKGLRRLVAPGSMSAGQINGDHVQDLIDAGDVPSAANLLGYLYRYRPKNAIDIIKGMPPASLEAITPMLPPGMMAALRPQPVKPPAVEASILPGGEVLIKKGSVYEITLDGKKTSFVASPMDAVRIAMTKASENKEQRPS